MEPVLTAKRGSQIAETQGRSRARYIPSAPTTTGRMWTEQGNLGDPAIPHKAQDPCFCFSAFKSKARSLWGKNQGLKWKSLWYLTRSSGRILGERSHRSDCSMRCISEYWVQLQAFLHLSNSYSPLKTLFKCFYFCESFQCSSRQNKPLLPLYSSRANCLWCDACYFLVVFWLVKYALYPPTECGYLEDRACVLCTWFPIHSQNLA